MECLVRRRGGGGGQGVRPATVCRHCVTEVITGKLHVSVVQQTLEDMSTSQFEKATYRPIIQMGIFLLSGHIFMILVGSIYMGHIP